MAYSKIEWTEITWNPVTGCSKLSPGCQHCYAERMAKRLLAMGSPRYKNGFKITVHPDILETPLSWIKPRKIFVNSMSDLFHNEVPYEYVYDVFKVMIKAHQHRFQVLTKRAEYLEAICQDLPWPDNVWMGVSIENSDYLYRIKCLQNTRAKIKFLSLEPLLGPLGKLNLSGIDWVIVGGESGFGARAMNIEWVREIRDQCIENRVPFFFKQWGGVFKKKGGRSLDGQIWNQMPKVSGNGR